MKAPKSIDITKNHYFIVTKTEVDSDPSTQGLLRTTFKMQRVSKNGVAMMLNGKEVWFDWDEVEEIKLSPNQT